MRILTRFIAAALLVLGLAVQTVSPAAAEEKSTLDAVLERGVLKAGLKTDAPIFGFINEKGEHVGFEVDILREIAKRLDVKLEIEKVASSTRIPLLTSGRIDIVAATMTHYRKRDDVIDFSIGYLEGPMTMLVRKDSGIKSLADMKGKIAGFNVGSAALLDFEKQQPDATLKTYEGLPEAFLALQQGLVDALPTDIILLAGLKANVSNPDDYVILGPSAHFSGGEYGLGVRENDSKWRDTINYLLQDMWNDGTWDVFYDKWMGKNSDLNIPKDDLGFEMTVWK